MQDNINRDYELKMRAVNEEASYKIKQFEEEHQRALRDSKQQYSQKNEFEGSKFKSEVHGQRKGSRGNREVYSSHMMKYATLHPHRESRKRSSRP